MPVIRVGALMGLMAVAALGCQESDPSPYERGSVLLLECQYEQAIEALDEAIRLNLGLFDSYYGRGYARGKLGQHELALQDLNEAIRRNPTNGGVYYIRSLSHAAMGDDQQSERDILKAQELRYKIPTGDVRPGC